MSFTASNLTTLDGFFYFKKRVPKQLQTAYGRKVISQSLRTRDPKEAQRRARQHLSQLEQEFAAIGHQTQEIADGYAGTLLHLSDDIGKRMLLAWAEGVRGLRDERTYSAAGWVPGAAFDGLYQPAKLKAETSKIGRSPLLGKR